LLGVVTTCDPEWVERLRHARAQLGAVCARVRLFTHAKSLGGVESLIDERGPALVRVSVGCEHAEDLWADLEQAL
jgi:cystathionine gamma-synthase